MIVVHYSEIALKGKNRPLFEKKLVENIKKAIGSDKVRRVTGRIFVYKDDNDTINSLKKVFGIAWFGKAYKLDRDEGLLKNFLRENLKGIKTVKFNVKRHDKNYPKTSWELNLELLKFLKRELGILFSKNPEKIIEIEILEDSFLVVFEKIKGPGGLPVGISGKVLVLLSGGIDSAVASYMIMKRGCLPYYVHFHSFPNNKDVYNTKILELVKKLVEYSYNTKLFLVPTYYFQAEALKANRKLEMILFRRFMFKVSSEIAKREGIKALVTGDNIGQVASQTIENLYVVDKATDLLVLRPLLTYNKEEIIDIAKNIGTYDISIKEYKDCCSIIARHPSTRASLEEVLKEEEKISMEKIVEKTLNEIDVVEFP